VRATVGVVVELPEVDQESLSEPVGRAQGHSRRTSGRSKNTKASENRILIKEGEAVEERDVLLHGPG